MTTTGANLTQTLRSTLATASSRDRPVAPTVLVHRGHAAFVGVVAVAVPGGYLHFVYMLGLSAKAATTVLNSFVSAIHRYMIC